jgi:hypothetical protein
MTRSLPALGDGTALCLICPVAAMFLGVGLRETEPDLRRLPFPTMSTNGDQAVLPLASHPGSSSHLHLNVSDRDSRKERRGRRIAKKLGAKAVVSSHRRNPHLAGLVQASVVRIQRDPEILLLHRPRMSRAIGDPLGLHGSTANPVRTSASPLRCLHSHCPIFAIATTSTPPTPQMGRRKLELLPRSGPSAAPSPLSSPRMAPASSGTNTPRSNPFGDAK